VPEMITASREAGQALPIESTRGCEQDALEAGHACTSAHEQLEARRCLADILALEAHALVRPSGRVGRGQLVVADARELAAALAGLAAVAAHLQVKIWRASQRLSAEGRRLRGSGTRLEGGRRREERARAARTLAAAQD